MTSRGWPKSNCQPTLTVKSISHQMAASSTIFSSVLQWIMISTTITLYDHDNLFGQSQNIHQLQLLNTFIKKLNLAKTAQKSDFGFIFHSDNGYSEIVSRGLFALWIYFFPIFFMKFKETLSLNEFIFTLLPNSQSGTDRVFSLILCLEIFMLFRENIFSHSVKFPSADFISHFNQSLASNIYMFI